MNVVADDVLVQIPFAGEIWGPVRMEGINIVDARGQIVLASPVRVCNLINEVHAYRRNRVVAAMKELEAMIPRMEESADTGGTERRILLREVAEKIKIVIGADRA